MSPVLSHSCHSKHVCLQAAWVTLLWHASIPRPILLAQLHETGRLQALLNSYSLAAATDPMLQLARDVSCRSVPVSDAELADNMHALQNQAAALSRRHRKPQLGILQNISSAWLCVCHAVVHLRDHARALQLPSPNAAPMQASSAAAFKQAQEAEEAAVAVPDLGLLSHPTEDGSAQQGSIEGDQALQDQQALLAVAEQGGLGAPQLYMQPSAVQSTLHGLQRPAPDRQGRLAPHKAIAWADDQEPQQHPAPVQRTSTLRRLRSSLMGASNRRSRDEVRCDKFLAD